MSAHAESGSAFDRAARRYDENAAHNPMMRWLRRESLRYLVRAFGPGDAVVEVGCGTGVEAIALARHGVSVLATDASPEMIGVLRDKLATGSYDAGEKHDSPRATKSPPGSVTPSVLPVEGLAALTRDYGAGAFSGAYSSLGALNCAPDLAGTAAALASLVKPGGRVVVSMLNKYCAWETAWYLALGRPRLAFRRWGGRTTGTALPGGATLEVYYWPVREIEAAFRPFFHIRTRRALPWMLPPTYAAGFLERRAELFAAIERVEVPSSRVWPFYAIGDHLHLQMVRRPARGLEPG